MKSETERGPKKHQKNEQVRHEIIGKSPTWLAQIQKVADHTTSDQTVLITGESGTGKDVCAKAIHYNSSRSGKPFIAFNCAQPEELIENELFGHVAGAFTSANRASGGLFAYAAGGTLFLDEIEELSRSAQAKFLRVLEDKKTRALGSFHRSILVEQISPVHGAAEQVLNTAAPKILPMEAERLREHNETDETESARLDPRGCALRITPRSI